MESEAELVFWVCSSIAVVGAILATVFGQVRHAALALTFCGIGVGGIFLAVGAELLAVVQWLVSTLIGVSFIFYSVLFGPEGKREDLTTSGLAMLLGGVFIAVLWIGLRDVEFDVSRIEAVNTSLQDVGRVLVDEHLVSLETLGLTLFLVIIGAGVISRPEVRKK